MGSAAKSIYALGGHLGPGAEPEVADTTYIKMKTTGFITMGFIPDDGSSLGGGPKGPPILEGASTDSSSAGVPLSTASSISPRVTCDDPASPSGQPRLARKLSAKRFLKRLVSR